jgi:elongator complex protein 3
MDSYENLIIKKLIQNKVETAEEFFALQRKLSKEFKRPFPQNIYLLKAYRELVKTGNIKPDIFLENILKTRKIRSLSGIVSITVITKPYPCPGKCLYCPDEIDMPKSYLANEPACMRAVLTKFDPYKQVDARIKSLQLTGHTTDKIELIVLGGTWSAYPLKYQTWFIKRCFDACNHKNAKNLKEAQKLNEKAKNRIIGLTLETRPDYITAEEIKRMRDLGCTRIELGVQGIYDDVLKYNKRGHDVATIIRATKLLKNAGFKVAYHMMLNLPNSTLKKDDKMLKQLFSNPDFQPDQLKIYPCVVLKTAPLYKLWQEKKYKPYSEKQLINLLIKIKQKIPPYVRIIRIIRDIPSQSIVAGNKMSNLRQILQQKKVKCRCIRCREPHEKIAKKLKLFRQNYSASGGEETFLSYEDSQRKNIYAFLRIRITNNWTLPTLRNSALIRELHTYGLVVPLKSKTKKAVQHKGLGKKLMEEAEKIAKKEFGFKKIAVIAGIGVREYYRKLGYKFKDEYMIKSI